MSILKLLAVFVEAKVEARSSHLVYLCLPRVLRQIKTRYLARLS